MNKFTSQDISQIEKHGLNSEDVKLQLLDFEHGFAPANIVSAAKIGDGIIQTDFETRQILIKIYQDFSESHKIVKFIPASGAATRMFKDFFDFVKTGIPNKSTDSAIANIKDFAFYDELQKMLPSNATDIEIINCILLNYSSRPKALIPFHKYNNYCRIAIEEHLVEGFQYANCKNNVNIHFTVSPEHRTGFQEFLDLVLPEYESRFKVKYNISMSEQKNSTDTVAVNPDKTLFREQDGSLLFRPSGHGALIENLNDLETDLIFIKNIDNVTTDSLRDDTVEYKKTLAGLLVSLQDKVFTYLHAFDNNFVNLDAVEKFIEQELMIKLPKDIDLKSRADIYFNILNRPIRVCGMVKNEGEPGGGPFWVKDNKIGESLKIVESSQIAEKDLKIMKESTHFNPVDLVCGTKDYLGKKFNLREFIDSSTGFISEKSRDGAVLLAMEKPGLWNGAMAKWNTIFVEVPISTFSPVKVLNDLLRPQHSKQC